MWIERGQILGWIKSFLYGKLGGAGHQDIEHKEQGWREDD